MSNMQSKLDSYFAKKHGQTPEEFKKNPSGSSDVQNMNEEYESTIANANLNSVVTGGKKKKKSNNKDEFKSISTVQETVPYEAAFGDGIFLNNMSEYSKMYPILDVNFITESDEEQLNIYGDFQDMFNAFSSDTHLQICMVNSNLDKESFHDKIFVKMQNDEHDDLRAELNKVYESKENIGDNSIVKERYLVVSIQADSINDARTRFVQIDETVKKMLGKINHSEPAPISTIERLKIMHDFYNSGKEKEFLKDLLTEEEKQDIKKFKLGTLKANKMTTKDVIVPHFFKFGPDKMIIGDMFAQALVVKDYSTVLNSDFLVALNNNKCTMMTSVHYEIVDREDAAKRVARMQTAINSEVIDAQKKAGKAGYDPEFIPQRIKYESESIQEFRDAIQKYNQKIIKVTIIIVHLAKTLEDLNRQSEEIKSIGRAKLVEIVPLKEQQEMGLNTVLPLGHNYTQMYKSLTTQQAAILIPFELQEMTQKGGFYYGINTESKRLLIYNRKMGDNYNALILGRSGSGKSFKAKEEILSSYLGTNDDIIILDPQGEYTPFAKQLGGEAIYFTAGCGTHINPFDMDLNYSDDDNSSEAKSDPLVLKSSYISSFCEIAVGGRYGLTQAQRSIIDRAIRIVYKPFLESGGDQNLIPTMQDFYEVLKMQPEAEAVQIYRPLEQYAIGSLDLFSYKTNVVLNNRLTCYNIKQLTHPSLKDMALVACLNDIWNRTLENRKKGKFTWIYLDEFHLFLKSAAVEDFLMSIWKRARQFGGGPTGITQNITDLLKSQAAEAIFSNSSLIVMLNQAPPDRMAISSMLNLSQAQQKYVNNAQRGSGLLWTGQSVIPFKDEFPVDNKLYKMMSTDANEANKNIMETVTSMRQNRNVEAVSEAEKKEEEYKDFQKEQTETYKDSDVLRKQLLEKDKELRAREEKENQRIKALEKQAEENRKQDKLEYEKKMKEEFERREAERERARLEKEAEDRAAYEKLLKQEMEAKIKAEYEEKLRKETEARRQAEEAAKAAAIEAEKREAEAKQKALEAEKQNQRVLEEKRRLEEEARKKDASANTVRVKNITPVQNRESVENKTPQSSNVTPQNNRFRVRAIENDDIDWKEQDARSAEKRTESRSEEPKSSKTTNELLKSFFNYDDEEE